MTQAEKEIVKGIMEQADRDSIRGRREWVDRKFTDLEGFTRGAITLLYMSRPGDGAVRYHVSTPNGSRTLKGLKAAEEWLRGVDVGIDAMTEARGWGE